MSCSRFYSNPCGVKSIAYLKLLFISLGSPLVALELEKIFKLSKSCVMSEKLEPKSACYNSPHTCGASCNTDYCLTKISIRAKRSISRVFSLFIVPSPFFVHCPYKGRINRAESVLTGLKPY